MSPVIAEWITPVYIALGSLTVVAISPAILSIVLNLTEWFSLIAARAIALPGSSINLHGIPRIESETLLLQRATATERREMRGWAITGDIWNLGQLGRLPALMARAASNTGR